MLAREEWCGQRDQQHGGDQLGLGDDQLALFAHGHTPLLKQVERQRHVKRGAQQKHAEPVLPGRIGRQPAPRHGHLWRNRFDAVP